MATAPDGLYLEPDTSDYTDTALTTGDADADDLVDSVLYTAAISQWDQHNSYGIDLGSSDDVTKLTITCYVPDSV